MTCFFIQFRPLYGFKQYFIYMLPKFEPMVYYFIINNFHLTSQQKAKHTMPHVCIILYVKGGYVRVILTSMRRILSTILLRHFTLFGRNSPSHIFLSAGEHCAFAQNFCSKTTVDTMDLSNMRKKYKGDEEVSGKRRINMEQFVKQLKERVTLWRCKVRNQSMGSIRSENTDQSSTCLFVTLHGCFRPWTIPSAICRAQVGQPKHNDHRGLYNAWISK